MVLWGTNPPSSQPAGFPNKVVIPCANTMSLDLLACHAVSSTSLDSVTNFMCLSCFGLVCVFLFFVSDKWNKMKKALIPTTNIHLTNIMLNKRSQRKKNV